MTDAFVFILVGMAATMSCGWLVQRLASNAGWTDVFWTFGAGAACVAAALWPSPAASEGRRLLVAALGALWSLRLGLYIAARVLGGPEDARYAGFREEWGATFQSRLFGLMIIQAPATGLLTLSVFAAAHGGAASLGWRDALGALALAIAVGGEGLADEQMRRFKQSAPHGPIMDKGLWSWSRHPNYFFEWLGWLAYPLIGLDLTSPLSYTTLIAPGLMFAILRYGTGVPALERSMLQKRGDAFVDYQARVSAFFPLPPRRTSP